MFDEWLTAHDAGAGGSAEDELSARLLFADDTDPATMLRVLDRLQENVWFYGKSRERARPQALAEADAPAGGESFRALPLMPIWRGLAADTAIHAGAWLVAIPVFIRIRAVIRGHRGLCPACAYDLQHRHTDGCPECGWNRRPSAAA